MEPKAFTDAQSLFGCLDTFPLLVTETRLPRLLAPRTVTTTTSYSG